MAGPKQCPLPKMVTREKHKKPMIGILVIPAVRIINFEDSDPKHDLLRA